MSHELEISTKLRDSDVADCKDSTGSPAQSTSSLPESPQEYNDYEVGDDPQGDIIEEGDGTSDTELGGSVADEMSDSEMLLGQSAPEEMLVTRQTQNTTFENSILCIPKEDDILNSDGRTLSATQSTVTIESERSDLESSEGKDSQ